MNEQARSSRIKLQRMVIVALFAALLCVLSPWSVPIGAVPITFATLGVYLIGVTLGSLHGTIAVLVYLILGLVGLPVFSRFSGGVGVLIGPTGGYLIGYLPCVAIAGLSRRWQKIWLCPVWCVLGTLACYALGTVWFIISTGTPLAASLSVCVVPFLPFDALKIAAATLLAPPLRLALRRAGL